MSAFRKFTGESAILKMRSRINRITAMSLVSPFLEHGVYAKFEKVSSDSQRLNSKTSDN